LSDFWHWWKILIGARSEKKKTSRRTPPKQFISFQYQLIKIMFIDAGKMTKHSSDNYRPIFLDCASWIFCSPEKPCDEKNKFLICNFFAKT